jgi:hypothetical protein
MRCKRLKVEVISGASLRINKLDPKRSDPLAHIPGAEFTTLPEAAHSINWERREVFNGNVLRFIRRH